MVDCLDLDPTGMSRGELSQQLLDIEALRSRLDAAAMWATQVWDAQQVWVDDGARTGAAWLRHHAGMSSRRASAQLRTARDLRSMPCTAAAFEHGDLTVEKVQLLAWARTDATAGLFDQFEQTLVDAARTCVYDDLVKAVRHWKAGAESLGFANDPDAMVHGRHASVSETLDGAVKVDGWLGPESGQVFKRVFDAIDRELARQERRDRDNAVGAPARTAPQRHADALTEMARRAAASDPDTARRARPEVIVHLDWATLVAEAGGVGHFANGCPVSGEAARRLACDAGIARVITNGPSEILDLGRRTPSAAAARTLSTLVRSTDS